MTGGVWTEEMCCLAQIDSRTVIVCPFSVARRSKYTSTGRGEGRGLRGD
jgi:hypothetical protein